MINTTDFVVNFNIIDTSSVIFLKSSLISYFYYCFNKEFMNIDKNITNMISFGKHEINKRFWIYVFLDNILTILIELIEYLNFKR